MASIRVRAALLGIAFAILVGAACSFFGSPWSTAWDWPVVWPIIAGGAVGFAFGLLAAQMPRVGWIVWLLTLPGVVAWAWFGIGQCNAQPVHDDCELAWILPLGWLVPWAIGIGLLALATFVGTRRAQSSSFRGTSEPSTAARD